ncbi:T9SS type A sorting domain-containing protein [Aquimarina algiphila]|uniref:T9SS type A sorting domain-containing protein n=1 Tax=Aquimarina algiphila TaxID=2047982 RepID=UPI00232E39EA|nr:T9SS type A sorting domain-containing protein [Aquimarina algiphila]
MRKIIILLVLITGTISNISGQEGITLTEGNKAYYKLTVSGNRSYSDGPWFFGTTVCDKGIKEIRFLDKNNQKVKTVGTNGKTGVFSYNTGDHEFTKDQFPIQIHIDSDFVDRLLCKGFAIYDFPQSWYTDDFRNRGMDVIKVEYNRACYPQGYTGFWSPDGRNYGDIFYYHAAYVYMRDLEVKSDPIIELKTPSEPLYLGDDEYITVAVPDSFIENYSYYWKYKVGNDRYRSISSRYVNVENGKKVLRIKGKEFLTPAAYGKRVRLELDAGCGVSNPISFTYYPSAPHVTKIETVDPICYRGDGEVKISFSRNLNNSVQEKLTINLANSLGVIHSSGIHTSFTQDNNKYSYTFTGVKAGEYNIEFAGGNMTIGGQILSTVVRDPKDPINIVDPTQVLFSTNIKDSSCNDGDDDPDNNNDGKITITAEGGRDGVYQYSIQSVSNTNLLSWYNFENNDSHIVENLQPDLYKIRVRKKVGNIYCNGYLKDDVSAIIAINFIKEPTTILKVDNVFYKEPTAFGFEDGKIRYLITGGTPFDDGTYTYEWKDSQGTVLNTVHTEVLPDDEGSVITLHSIGADIYTLKVTDKNYNEATYTTGCFEENITFNLKQPDPLKVTFEIVNPISCNINNEYNNGRDFEPPLNIPDQFQDGELVAHVTGGVRYNTEAIVSPTINVPRNQKGNQLPYYYHWKKKINNVWKAIPVNDSIINHQSFGDYALNITDKNGIVLGNYISIKNSDDELEYILATAIDSTMYLTQPTKLEITFEKTIISCFSGADATARAIVKGGTPPYSYYWSNGANSAFANNLKAGKHSIYVTDSKGCTIEGIVSIDQPNGLEIQPINITEPTCHQGNNGRIQITVKGGNPPYSYLWNTGNTSTEIKDLTAGTYILEVTDSKGCKAFYEKIVKDPEPIVINLNEKKSLCDGQTLSLDVTINDPKATYSWSANNGFTSNSGTILIDQTGLYTATVTNGLGCSNQATIKVVVFDTAIDAHYLIATQAYVDQEVTLINISDPVGEKVEWSISEEVNIIKEDKNELTVIFDKEGTYEINLRSHMGDCFEDFTKKIIVQPAIATYKPSDNDSFIKEFILFPNPNTGAFQSKIALEKASDISVKIINLSSGAVLSEKIGQNNTDFLLDYSVSFPSGVYLVLLETPQGSSRRKLVIE